MPDAAAKEIVWGDDSFKSRAEAESGIASYLVNELENSDYGIVEIDGESHLLRVIVEIVD